MDAPHGGSVEDVARTLDDGNSVSAMEEVSLPFAGRWHRLVSSTNWEKGRIISQWRAAMVASGAVQNQFTDEAWALYVGGVTGQHVGRLRRVWDRFGDVRESYPGLYWSHFQASLDWDDAELWLEGASQNRWAINRMRLQRMETLGQLASSEAETSVDEPSEIDDTGTPGVADPENESHEGLMEFHDPDAQRFSDSDREDDSHAAPAGSDVPPWEDESRGSNVSRGAKPFSELPELPDELAEVVESLKLLIVRYRQAQWQEFGRDDLLAVLGALREFVLAPG